MEIPKIETKENEVVLPTLKVPIIVNDKEEFVVMQKIPSGKRRDVLKSSLKTRIVGQQMQADIDAGSYQIALLSVAIIEAPFDFTEKGIEKLADEVIDYLWKAYSEEFGQTEKKD